MITLVQSKRIAIFLNLAIGYINLRENNFLVRNDSNDNFNNDVSNDVSNDTNLFTITKYTSFSRQRNRGCDERFNETDDEPYIDPTWFKKKELLDYLSDSNKNNHAKLNEMEFYEKKYGIAPIKKTIMSNITNGGLFKDWNWD
jgi:hypothetical protein